MTILLYVDFSMRLNITERANINFCFKKTVNSDVSSAYSSWHYECPKMSNHLLHSPDLTPSNFIIPPNEVQVWGSCFWHFFRGKNRTSMEWWREKQKTKQLSWKWYSTASGTTRYGVKSLRAEAQNFMIPPYRYASLYVLYTVKGLCRARIDESFTWSCI